ncbi:hypothetical protein JYU34_002222 [Plutella xylostella]|uniref:Uncharacterized protein n=1 Tax=Plutella xylostella TaxID=51655 RepID=A0ABQ7R1P7_PLUXY|nr:hypothetical protein JYU34_002222 [Plutella xylostella]
MMSQDGSKTLYLLKALRQGTREFINQMSCQPLSRERQRECNLDVARPTFHQDLE